MPKTLGISLIIFLSFIQVSLAEKTIAFIDIDVIMTKSEFGKKSYKKIDDDFNKENEKLIIIEKKQTWSTPLIINREGLRFCLLI